jgi:hypothetical protein
MTWWKFWKRESGPSAASIGREVLDIGVVPHSVVRDGPVVAFTVTVTVAMDLRRGSDWLDTRGAAIRLVRKTYKALRQESEKVHEKYLQASAPAGVKDA